MTAGRSRRAGWSLADQAVSSLTNLSLSILVARRVDADAFGAFGLVFTVYLLVIGASRAICAEPLLVRCSDVPADEHRRAARLATGTALMIGTCVGALTVAAGLAAGGELRGPMLVLGVCLPGLVLQDTIRHVLFAAARPRDAAANDAVWAVALAATLIPVLLAAGDSVTALTGAWALSACVAALIGIAQIGVGPTPTDAGVWLRDHRSLIPGFLGEFVVRNGARYLSTFAVGAVTGLAALAGLRGAQVLFGPLNMVLLAVPLVAIPEAVRIRNADLDRLWSAMRVLSAALGAVGLACGVAALLIPDALGEAILGASWVDTKPILVPQALLLASIGAVSGYLTGLRALAAPTESLVTRIVMLPVGLAAGVLGAVMGGAAGATLGIAAANWLAVGVWHIQFHRALDRARFSPVAGAPTPSRPSPGR